jgi:drug/metabolite transporter (DMT)-like permease
LTATRAAIVQLLVPVLAAAAGVVVLNEIVSVRLVLGGTIMLAGVLLAVLRAERL